MDAPKPLADRLIEVVLYELDELSEAPEDRRAHTDHLREAIARHKARLSQAGKEGK